MISKRPIKLFQRNFQELFVAIDTVIYIDYNFILIIFLQLYQENRNKFGLWALEIVLTVL